MRKPSGTRIAQAIGSALVVLALFLYVLPAYARAASLLAGERSESEMQELIDWMLSSGDYVEGEAIVCFLPAADEGLTAQADPLAGAELLSQVTARQYAEATGEAVPAADEVGVLTAQAGEEQVQVVLVRSQDVDTEGLLHELLADPRVLSAEPNYRMQFADDEDMDVVEGAQEEEALGEPDNSCDTVEDAEPFDEPAVSVEEVSTDGEADSGDELATAYELATADELVTADEEVDDTLDDTSIEEPLTAQGDTAGPASPDLTAYQWFSTGVADAIPQYLDEANLGVNVPSWNQSGATNATGVVAILDTGVDYEHPDLEKVMYHFSPELQDELVCGES